jgi:hypothetical protein
MSSESPEDPYRSPEVTQVSTVKTPGVLGMVGVVIISLLAAGGACCASCFGALFLGDFSGDFGIGVLLCGLVTLGTFIGVLVLLTRTVNAGRRRQDGDSGVVP